MAKVEVFDSEQETWFPATLENCTHDVATVSFPDNWKPRESLPHNQVRLAAPMNPSYSPKVGDVVETLSRIQETNVLSWWKATVSRVEGKFIFVKYPDDYEEILEENRIRPASTEGFVSPKLFNRIDIHIPGDLLDIARKPAEHESFRELCGLFSVGLSDDGRSLVLTGSKLATEKGELLSNVHFRRLSEVKRLENLRHLVEAHSEEAAPVSIKFPVATELIGLAIGKLGANISAAREINDIVRVEILENNHILIQGRTAEAVAEAREWMDICSEVITVNRADIGFLIGREGRSLEEIIERSGVASIQTPTNSDAAQGTFEIVGRRKNVEKARLLIDATLQLLQESRQLTQESAALNAQLRSMGVRVGGPAYGRGRGRGRGGLGRGGARGGGPGAGRGGDSRDQPPPPQQQQQQQSQQPQQPQQQQQQQPRQQQQQPRQQQQQQPKQQQPQQANKQQPNGGDQSGTRSLEGLVAGMASISITLGGDGGRVVTTDGRTPAARGGHANGQTGQAPPQNSSQAKVPSQPKAQGPAKAQAAAPATPVAETAAAASPAQTASPAGNKGSAKKQGQPKQQQQKKDQQQPPQQTAAAAAAAAPAGDIGTPEIIDLRRKAAKAAEDAAQGGAAANTSAAAVPPPTNTHAAAPTATTTTAAAAGEVEAGAAAHGDNGANAAVGAVAADVAAAGAAAADGAKKTANEADTPVAEKKTE